MPPEQQREQQPIVQVPSHTPLDVPVAKDKFKLFRAIRPSLSAIKHNIGLISVGAVASIVLYVIQQLILSPFSAPQVNVTGLPVQQTPLWTIPVYILFILIGIFIGIYSNLVIADGAHREKERILAYIQASTKKYWRVLVSYLLIWVAIILPVIGVGIITGAFWTVGTLTDIRELDVFNIILLVITVIGVYVWIIAAIIRFSMVGLIALFEPDILVRHSLRRSWQLLEGTGEWFVLKLGISIGIVFGAPWTFVVYQILKKSSFENLYNITLLASLLYIPIGIFSAAMLVILYLNRIETKPPFRANQTVFRGWKMKSFVMLVILSAVTIGILTPSLIRHNRQQIKLRQEQHLAQQKSNIDNNLKLFNDKVFGYSIKLPKDFVFTRYDEVTGNVYRSGEQSTPFVVSVQVLPTEPNLVYVNEAKTNYETNLMLLPLDNNLQQLTGSTNGSTVSGDINIPGTQHKRGFFANYSVNDVSGEELDIDILIVPKDDGSAVMFTFTSLKRYEKNLEPVFEVIKQSINLQPK